MKSKLFSIRILYYQAICRKVWLLYKFGFVGNVYNWLSYGVIHNGIASYAHLRQLSGKWKMRVNYKQTFSDIVIIKHRKRGFHYEK